MTTGPMPDDRTDWQEPPEDDERPDSAEPWHGEHELTEGRDA